MPKPSWCFFCVPSIMQCVFICLAKSVLFCAITIPPLFSGGPSSSRAPFPTCFTVPRCAGRHCPASGRSAICRGGRCRRQRHLQDLQRAAASPWEWGVIWCSHLCQCYRDRDRRDCRRCRRCNRPPFLGLRRNNACTGAPCKPNASAPPCGAQLCAHPRC